MDLEDLIFLGACSLLSGRIKETEEVIKVPSQQEINAAIVYANEIWEKVIEVKD